MGDDQKYAEKYQTVSSKKLINKAKKVKGKNR